MLLSITALAFLVSAAYADDQTRTEAQIREFVLSPPQPCADTSYESTGGGCVTDSSDISVCSGGTTFCYPSTECGMWAGMEGCCVENYDDSKSSTPGDPTSNTSCNAYQQQLKNFNFGERGGVLPSSAFCDASNYPGNYGLVGEFSTDSTYTNISADTTGEVCCPNYLDAVVVTTLTAQNQTLALCVPWFVRDGQSNSSSSSGSSGSSSSGSSSPSSTPSSGSSSSSSSHNAGAMLVPSVSTMGTTIFGAFAAFIFMML